MKKIAILSLLTLLFAAFLPLAASADELGDLAVRINTRFGVDLGPFRAKVNAEFGTGEPKIEAVIRAAGSAGDAYIAFQVGKACNRDPEEVARIYSRDKGKGWGVIAKEMGIKPGSAEFHALKKGRLMEDDDHRSGGSSDDHGGKGKGDHGLDDKGGGKGKGKGK